MLAFVLLAGAGCSGINASGSVSPASFFLPGLMKADPPASTAGAGGGGRPGSTNSPWPDNPLCDFHLP